MWQTEAGVNVVASWRCQKVDVSIMQDDVEQVRQEVRALRKGRGVLAADLEKRLGPQLRQLAGDGGDRPDVRRRALVAELSVLAARMPADLRLAVEVSLGLCVDTKDMAHLEDRVSWLTSKLERAHRTVLRRIDAAEILLAEEIIRELDRRSGRPHDALQGWFYDELRTILRLDTAVPEAYEHRRITATIDGLDQITLPLGLPSSPANPRPIPAVEVLFGGRLVALEHPWPHRYQFVIRLPMRLAAGQQHEFGLLVRVHDGMQPHYVFTPECRCNRFLLRARFDAKRPPRWVRPVRGETVRMFEAPRPAIDPARLDEAGELDLRFDGLVMHLGYGIQWQP
ncbi:MAG TPA: hypothetical protein VFC19_03980 [Candidatus Limnocylindrales bacterium]|nr:hypothetical protein [Candidatus Limnocylindrales bacterium]